MNYSIKEQSQESKLKKPLNSEKSIIKNLNYFIEKNRIKYNYVSKNEIRLREKKQVSRSHYVGYDPEED